MKKSTIIGIILAAILIIAAFIIYSSDSKASYIQEQIAESNYCESKEDCVNIGSKCPFGCAIYVNAAQSTQMKELIDSYESTCSLECAQVIDVACNNNKCEATTLG